MLPARGKPAEEMTMGASEVEFMYACEALAAARDAARPDLALIAALRERVRVAQRAFWATLDGDPR